MKLELLRGFCCGAHQDQGSLGEGGVDEQRSAGDGQAIVDVVKEQERRECPEFVEGQENGPDAEEIGAGAGGVQQRGGENEGADGDEDGGGDNEDVER